MNSTVGRIIFYVSLVLLLPLCSRAQVSLIRNYTVSNGLASSEVYQVMQDSKGYMWFATDKGVSRFDGYHFHTYTTADGLADNTVFECLEDYRNRIWFRSFSGKLSYFYNDTIFQLPVNDDLIRMLHGARLTSMSISRSEILSLGAYGLVGILQIDLKNKYALTTIPIPFPLRSYIGLDDSNKPISGHLHAEPSPIIKRKEPERSCISVYNLDKPGDSARTLFFLPGKQEPERYHTRLRDRAVILRDHTLAASIDSRLLIFKEGHPIFDISFPDMIVNMNPDQNGGLWIVFLSGPPVYYRNGKTETLPQLENLGNKQITSVTTDREGGIWLTSLNDGAFYLPSLAVRVWTHENGLPSDKVNNVSINTRDSSVWITYSNLHSITRIGQEKTETHPVPNLGANDRMSGILFPPDGGVYVLTNMNVQRFSTEKAFCNVAVNDVGCQLPVWNRDSSFWAINGDAFLTRYRNKGHKLESEIKKKVEAKVFALCRENDSVLWMGTMHGVWKYEKDSLSFLGNRYPILRKRISDIKCSPQHDVWIATRDTGIIILSGNRILRLTQRDGLPSNFCQPLFIDHTGNAWIGSSNGLSHILVHRDKAGIHIDTIQYINFIHFNEINAITEYNNYLYLATNNGLVQLSTHGNIGNTIPPPVFIQSFTVNNTPV
ncbi:MAG TPA: two-component regulator propeller domain-containing protein, partial [Bacteroidia bacterium]|nr:two-component regulator propeller domain-containing protein [Bacteroidia bacterium]